MGAHQALELPKKGALRSTASFSGTVIVNFMCQLGQATAPVVWSKASLDVALNTFF